MLPPEARRANTDPFVARPAAKPSYLVPGLLLALTAFTTTTLGAVWVIAARTDLPPAPLSLLTPEVIAMVWGDRQVLALGAQFALAVLTILICHELGHYLACRRYRLPATLPYFLPAPLGLGTLGAFIRIKAPIRARRQLFDVGIAGPIAGFVALVPFLLIGLSRSTVSPYREVTLELGVVGVQHPGDSLALHLATELIFGSLPPNTNIDYHPFVIGAWFGLLATALNLLPLGQLDGGHILYATSPRWFARLQRPLWVLLVVAGLWWPGWWVWSIAVLFLTGLRHPPVYDEHVPLDRRRRWLAWAALGLLILCFMPEPARLVALTDAPPPGTVLAAR